MQVCVTHIQYVSSLPWFLIADGNPLKSSTIVKVNKIEQTPWRLMTFDNINAIKITNLQTKP